MNKIYRSTVVSPKFEKVSKETYDRTINFFSEKLPKAKLVEYDDIKLPKRSSQCSAGYDFYNTIDLEFEIPDDDYIVQTRGIAMIPTFVKCKMPYDMYLSIYPRSGLGSKYGIRLRNTVGIVDSDYYGISNVLISNEGHIILYLDFHMFKYHNTIAINGDLIPLNKIKIGIGEKIVQGIFNRYYVTEDDNISNDRIGGFGSSDDNN